MCLGNGAAFPTREQNRFNQSRWIQKTEKRRKGRFSGRKHTIDPGVYDIYSSGYDDICESRVPPRGARAVNNAMTHGFQALPILMSRDEDSLHTEERTVLAPSQETLTWSTEQRKPANGIL
ncbi:hypothetical protein BaRGS_00023436 [Batillaria attramentaria]|uniref:Uncharacterized protein n=1 Tax=Batillaria attramentaria TaxID=370345 RepID=A0ABD0KE69_9CAEN